MQEIVAAKIGNIITNDPKIIIFAIEAGAEFELIDRCRMKFMAACDFGRRWERLANSPTLFRIDKNGELCA